MFSRHHRHPSPYIDSTGSSWVFTPSVRCFGPRLDALMAYTLYDLSRMSPRCSRPRGMAVFQFRLSYRPSSPQNGPLYPIMAPGSHRTSYEPCTYCVTGSSDPCIIIVPAAPALSDGRTGSTTQLYERIFWPPMRPWDGCPEARVFLTQPTLRANGAHDQ